MAASVRLAEMPQLRNIVDISVFVAFFGVALDGSCYAFRSLPDRLPAYWRRSHGPVQLALRASSWRSFPIAHRRYRSDTLDPSGC
jgi:hypothetical protein